MPEEQGTLETLPIVGPAVATIMKVRQLGQAKPPRVAPGAARVAALRDARKADGTAAFSPQDIAQYQRKTSQTLLNAGFTVSQIEAHWGATTPNSPEIGRYTADNIRRALTAGVGDLVQAGGDTLGIVGNPLNATINMITGSNFSTDLGETARDATGIPHGDPMAEAINRGGASALGMAGLARGGAQLATGVGKEALLRFSANPAADLAAGVGGGVGSEVARRADLGVPGQIAGSIIGGGLGVVGYGAASRAVREVLLNAYDRGEIRSASDFQTVVGRASGLEVADGTPAIPDTEMPDAGDFVTAAATAVVSHGGVNAGVVAKGVFKPSAATLNVQHNLEEIYRRNGTLPWDAIELAKKDAGLRQELLQQDVNGNSVAPRLHDMAPQEPPPIKPASEAAAEPESLVVKNPEYGTLWSKSKEELEALSKSAPAENTIDEGPISREMANEMLREHQNYSAYDTDDLVNVIRRTLVEQRRPDWTARVKAGQAVPEEQAAFVRLNGAVDALKSRGYPIESLGKDVVANLVEREGVSLLDAEELISYRFENLRGSASQATPTSGTMKNITPKAKAKQLPAPQRPRPAPTVKSVEDLLVALEGSRSDSVSPAGAIGVHQIMIGTARQYGFGRGMSQPELARWLHNDANNLAVFQRIMVDLKARFHGDQNAILIAYNAGPGRANTYMTKGPGTELEAILDKNARGGIRYVSRPSMRDESWLPMETQKYLANGRRQSSGTALAGTSGGGSRITSVRARTIAEGAGFKVNSGFRTRAEQEALYNDPNVNRPGNPVAKPGTSAHERDNALDIAFGKNVTPETLRQAYAAQGVNLTKIIKERGHYHIEWESRSGGSRSAALFPDANRHAPVEEGAGGGAGGKPPGGGEPPLLGGEDEGGSGPARKRYTFDEATEEIMANIGEPPKPTSLLNPTLLETQFLSELTPARNIDNDLVSQGLLNRTRSVGQEDMFRQTYASDTRTGAFVRFGILRIGDNEIEIVPDSPSMMRAVDEIHADGGNMRAWTAYMLSKRTADKEGQGVKTGFNRDAAEDMVNDPEARKYQKGTETFNKVMTGGLEYARDSGYLSQKQVDAMVRDNPAYISMRRIMGDDASFGSGRGKGFVPREALKKMEGSDRSIVDPIEATLDNLRVLISMADRNRAIGSIIGQVEGGKLGDLGLLKIEDMPNATMSAKAGDPFKPYGLGREGADDPAATYAPLLAERSQKGLKANEFIFYRDGVPERWSAKSEALVNLIRTSNTPGEVNIVGKVFDTVAMLDRSGIALSPSFVTRVSMLNEIQAFILDPLHPKPLITMMSGLHDSFTEKGVYKQWVANGGAGSALADMDIKWLRRDMEKTFTDQGVYARMWNRLGHPIEAFQWMSERMDAASRIGYYKQAVAKGLPPMKAATRSRTAYLDFAEKAGLEAVNSLARKVPFMRSFLLGTNQLVKAVSQRPWETFAYIGATESMVTAALYAANYLYDQTVPEGRNEEKFSAIPRWVLDTHHVAPPIAGARVQFPRLPIVGPLFGGATNRFLDWWLKEDPHAFDGWARSILSDFDPLNMMPTALKTPVEMTANYNFFTGHAIVPASVQAADGYMQYTNATTEPAKALSLVLGPRKLDVANVSPIQLEYLLKGITGTAGMSILKAVNGRMTDYQPPWQLADIPAVGTFFVRHPNTNAQQIQDFYDDKKAMEAAHADWSLALKHMDQGEIALASEGPFYGLRIVGKMAETMQVLSAAVVSVNKNPTMTPAEKSQATDDMVNAMIQMSVIGSGITATMQGKEPSKAFKDMDRGKVWEAAVAITNASPPEMQ